MRKIILAVALSLGATTAAQAATTVFQDDFSTITSQVPGPGGWLPVVAPATIVTPNMTYTLGATTGVGNFDVVDDTHVAGICEGARCIDLDGTSAGLNSYLYTNNITVQANTKYELTVRVGGNLRNTAPDNFIFGFLDSVSNNAKAGYGFVTGLAWDAGFENYTTSYTTGASETTLKLFVQNATAEPKYGTYAGLPGPDDYGPMLQSLSLTAVPLPAAVWLMLSGLAGVAAFGRRRKTLQVATA